MDRVTVLSPMFYCFCVPDLQDICGLTYGDGTRESYRWEQSRRGLAL